VLAMSPTTRDHVDDFWDLIDAFMNVILFLLLGLEMLAMPWNVHYVYAGCWRFRWCWVRGG